MLDEEVKLPKGTDQALILKLHQSFAATDKTKHKHFDVIKKSPNLFVIKHYAGDVAYNSTGLLAKNRDRLHDTLEALLPKTTSPVVKAMFEVKEEATTTTGAKKVQTLGSQFSSQLTDLMFTLHQCNPHYIRCIKPNAQKEYNVFNTGMVLRQMQYAGLFEAIRIRKSGFPFRKEFREFAVRYRVLLDSRDAAQLNSSKDYKKHCDFILTHVAELTASEWQLGKTKVFMRSSQRIILDQLRDKALTKKTIVIQAFARQIKAKKLFKLYKERQQQAQNLLATSRDVKIISEFLVDCRDKHVHLFILRGLEKFLKFLDEEARIITLLREANELNELVALIAALEQAQRLTSKFSLDNYRSDKEFGPLVEQANKQKAHLEAVAEARAKLNEAIIAENLGLLEKALESCRALRMEESELEKASKLLEFLVAEEKVMQDLREIEQKGNELELEEALEKARKVTPNDKRRADILKSTETLKGKYNQQLQGYIETKDEASIQSSLIPKLQQLKFDELVSSAQHYLTEQERLRELERIERERREAEERRRKEEEEERLRREAEQAAEEARVAETRKHLAAAEQQRLAEQDRQRREGEEAQRQAELEAERSRQEAEYEAEKAKVMAEQKAADEEREREKDRVKENQNQALRHRAAAVAAIAGRGPPPVPKNAVAPPPPLPSGDEDLPPPAPGLV
jgi:myosin heavy subunit